MVQAVLNLITHTFFTGLAIIGTGTVIHKIGTFIKKYESENEDAYRKAFDNLMINSVEEFNFCIDSLKIIVKSGTKGSYLLTDLFMGNKVIQKDKNGKIIISDKSKLYNNYENTIKELNDKVKVYQEELNKINKLKENQKNKKIHMSIKKKYEDDDSTVATNDNSDSDEDLSKKLKKDFSIQSSDQENEEEEDDDSDEELIIQQKK